MSDDTIYMKRALELARRGAGLTSPNPMVGALLVKDDRIIGEGFHRYDRLRHAESFAIEMAGSHARGSTLYCSLEPCCHFGRTPPCTTALIEAGIARAVVAIEDPDPRVRGCGIEQLRSAGIAVDVGLFEDEARKLNETYFKFVTTRSPFVHAVLAGDRGGARSVDNWKPSAALLEAVSQYDAVMLGRCEQANRAVIDACLNRERHRPLVIATARAAVEGAGLLSLAGRGGGKLLVFELESEFAKATEPELAAVSRMLASRHRVTSLAVLPGAVARDGLERAAAIDKLTVVTAAGEGTQIELDDLESQSSGEFDELTGYPRRAEID